MNIYTPDGWLNYPEIIGTGYPYIFITGGRGTGKTFGALAYERQHSRPGERFMFLRRTQTQIDLLNKPEFSPFKAIDEALGTHTVTRSVSKYNGAFYDGTLQDDGSVAPQGPPLGYTAALSTFSNLRGFDASDCVRILYDEFIPQPQERPIKEEAAALWNCYETVNRNRELSGRPPVQLICMANSNVLGNPIFLDLKLVRQAEKMRAAGRETWTDDKRGILMVLLLRSPISDSKRRTALYKLQEGSEFSRMALDNDFASEERSAGGNIPLRELVPVVAVGEICVYRVKSGGYYVSGHKSGSPETFGSGPRELERFRSRYFWLWQAYLSRKIRFEEYINEILLNKYFNA